jgi:hypothetical protein
VLELIKEALDEVAFAVERKVARALVLRLVLGGMTGVIPRWVRVSTNGSASYALSPIKASGSAFWSNGSATKSPSHPSRRRPRATSVLQLDSGRLRARFPPGANQEVPSLCCLDTFHCNIVTERPTQGLRKDGTPGLIPQGLAALTTFDPDP